MPFALLETRSQWVALVGLELAIYTRLALNHRAHPDSASQVLELKAWTTMCGQAPLPGKFYHQPLRSKLTLLMLNWLPVLPVH